MGKHLYLENAFFCGRMAQLQLDWAFGHHAFTTWEGDLASCYGLQHGAFSCGLVSTNGNPAHLAYITFEQLATSSEQLNDQLHVLYI